MKNGVSTVTLDHLIKAALTGQPNYNQQRLGREAERYSLHLSRAKAPDLPDDLHDEICQQAFVELMNVGAAALAKHSGKILFRRAVLAAIRSVRATYAPPGQRTRTAKEPRFAKIAAEDVGQVADPRAIERSSIREGDFAFVDFDRFRDRRLEAEMQRVEDAFDGEAILKRAPDDGVARALRLIHFDGEPLEAAAAQAKVSRFVLSRRIKAFCAEWQAAA